MKILRNAALSLAALSAIGITTDVASAQRQTGQTRVYVNERQAKRLLSRIETQTDNFTRELNLALDSSYINNTRSEDVINQYVRDFENATDNLRRNFDARQNVDSDVQEVLNRASYIDSFMREYRLNTSVERNWTLLRQDITQLARLYNINWNWNTSNYPYPSPTQYSYTLNGTYRLNTAQSDDAAAIVDRAVYNFPSSSRQQSRDNLLRRLEAPSEIAIERRNNEIRLALSNLPETTLVADGRTQTSRAQNGDTIRTTTTLSGERLVINSDGDYRNAFYASIEPTYNGQQLRVVRRVYLENRNQTVTVSSVYDKVSPNADFSIYRGGNYNTNYPNNQNYPNNGTYNNSYYIPNGTRLRARLNEEISTKNLVEGQRFTMTVTEPGQYSGAIITGTVANSARSGRVTGRAELDLRFETVEWRGQRYNFAALVDSVNANGENVNVNNEGVVRGDNQTKDTVTRGGIGAGIGAIIGAIAGGAKGAAIGAAIGAGAGAGSVVLQGRDDLVLKSGTEFNLTASAPANANR